MIKLVRAILIDPIREAITEIQHDASDHREIYKALSDPENGLAVDDFNAVYLNDGKDVLWVDGEGLLKRPKHFILWRGYHQPLAGRGLLLGLRGPDCCATKLTLAYVQQHVTYRRLSVQGFTVRDYVTDHPTLGPNVAVHERRPVFGPPEEDEK